MLKMNTPTMDNPLIALLTDFGSADYFVGSLKGAIARVNPRARTIDITHDVPSFDVRAAGFTLDACFRFFPEGTIFLSIVDPGVATRRKILLVRTRTYDFIAPDNGLLTLPLRRQRIREIRHVASPRFFLTAARTTFEGRDRMAPAAAWLSLGLDPRELGPRLKTFATIDIPRPVCSGRKILGAVLHIDKFGNIVTNVPARMVDGLRRGRTAKHPVISLEGRDIREFRSSYDSPKRGMLFALPGSLGLIEVAVREGSAAQMIGAKAGSVVVVSWGRVY